MSHPAEVHRLRDMFGAMVERDGYRHYRPLPAAAGHGIGELLQDAEVAQRLLDVANVPDGHPQGGGDIDTRVAALVLRVTDVEACLAEIADIHARETAPGGMVGDYCVECDRRWPCPTRELLDISSTPPAAG